MKFFIILNYKKKSKGVRHRESYKKQKKNNNNKADSL